MPQRTSSAAEENTSPIAAALMGIASENEDFNVVVEGTFDIDKYRQERFRKRINIKDHGVTRKPQQTDVATEEIEKPSTIKELPEWLSDKIGPYYTNEYIAIRRREHISHLLEYLKAMESVLGDKTKFLMYSKLLFNQIDSIYKSFLETRQDENFLSIVNLLEETLQHNEINKKILKEGENILKTIKDSDIVEYRDYEQAVSRFFSIGADIISIKETPDE
jgi:hypothetical protein